MSISDRYLPPHPPGESSTYALDYSAILPPGVGLVSGSLSIVTNTNPVQPAQGTMRPGTVPSGLWANTPAAASTDWTQGTVTTIGRRVYCSLSGGVEGTDYQFRWSAVDTLGNSWPRTCYVLCAQAS